MCTVCYNVPMKEYDDDMLSLHLTDNIAGQSK